MTRGAKQSAHRPRLTIAATVLAAMLQLSSPALADSMSVSATESAQFSGNVGSFNEHCPFDISVHAYDCGALSPSATIQWGDGSNSAAQISRAGCPNHACNFTVSGTHTYADEATYGGGASFDWSDSNGSGTVTGNATVADAQITIAAPSLSTTGLFASLSASFTDANGGSTSADYTASYVDWGDGQTSTPIINKTAGGWSVSAGHNYSSAQHSTPTLHVLDDGTDTTATAPGPPTALISQAVPVMQTGATLHGKVNPHYSAVSDCHFDWGTSTSYGGAVSCTPTPGSGGTDVAVSAALSGLSPSTTYYFRLVATNGGGTTTADTITSPGDNHFTTAEVPPPGAPVPVITSLSTTSTGATVSGTVNPNGTNVTDCHVEYGTVAGTYPNQAGCAPSPGSGTNNVAVSATLSGLSPDTTYYARLVATNPGGTAHSASVTIVTQPNCGVDAAFGFVDAKGCLSQHDGKYVSSPGSTVTLDGLTLVPTDSSTTITLDPAGAKVSSSGEITVSAGDVQVDKETINWTEPNPIGVNDVAIGDLKPPSGATVKGLPSLESGSSPIRSLQGAGLLSPPQVSAKVSGKGRKRTLTWHLRPAPGQTVVFKETGPNTAHVLGSTSARRGSLRFTPAFGRAGLRKIVALVMSHGIPRQALVVASYGAPGPLPLGRPGDLRVKAIPGGGIRVSWSPAANATQYVIEVDTSDGAHLIEIAKGNVRSIDIHDVVSISAATVRVAGETPTGRIGPVASVPFRR